MSAVLRITVLATSLPLSLSPCNLPLLFSSPFLPCNCMNTFICTLVPSATFLFLTHSDQCFIRALDSLFLFFIFLSFNSSSAVTTTAAAAAHTISYFLMFSSLSHSLTLSVSACVFLASASPIAFHSTFIACFNFLFNPFMSSPLLLASPPLLSFHLPKCFIHPYALTATHNSSSQVATDSILQ